MKKNTTFFFFLLLSALMWGQAPRVYINVPGTQVLFADMENPFFVTLLNIKSTQIDIVSDSLDIDFTLRGLSPKGDTAFYVAVPHTTGRTTLYARYQYADLDYRFSKQEFPVKEIPTPKVTLCGHSDGQVFRKAELRADSLLTPVIEGPYFASLNPSIVSFQLSLPDLETPYQTQGPALTPQMLQALRRLRPGSQITFSNILVQLPNGKQWTLSARFTLF